MVSGPHRVDEAHELGASEVVSSLDTSCSVPFDLVLDGVGVRCWEPLGTVCPQSHRRDLRIRGWTRRGDRSPAFTNAPLTELVGFFVYAEGAFANGNSLDWRLR